jgi:hypothetical protein
MKSMKMGIYNKCLIAAAPLVAAVLLLSCAQFAYPTPDYQDSPPVLTLEQLLDDYQSKPEEAGQKYEGKTYLFPSVEADRVVSQYINTRANLSEMYVESNSIRFQPGDVWALNPIGPGFILDIIGEVAGFIAGRLYVKDCSYIIIEGGDLPPPAGY